MKNTISVEVVGSGGAFDTDLINSSFIVRHNDKVYLVDCGYNVFPHLKENKPELLEEITDVIITHMDEDHVATLGTLIYYRWFVLGKPTNVKAGIKVGMGVEGRKSLVDYLPPRKELQDGNWFKNGMHHYETIYGYDDNVKDDFIYVIEGKHHVPAYGVVIGRKNSGMVAISGDTMANKEFERMVDMIYKEHECTSRYILHDKSDWDEPGNNPHATDTSIEETYSVEFRKELNYYHNRSNNLMGVIYEG